MNRASSVMTNCSATVTMLSFMKFACRGIARNLLRGADKPGVWGTEVPSGVQRQNMETQRGHD